MLKWRCSFEYPNDTFMRVYVRVYAHPSADKKIPKGGFRKYFVKAWVNKITGYHEKWNTEI
jgi:hypothetical protein